VSSVSAEGRTLPPDPHTRPPDPAALLRSTRYVRLLVLVALLGVPISAVGSSARRLVVSVVRPVSGVCRPCTAAAGRMGAVARRVAR
jgi:hypothetical protein